MQSVDDDIFTLRASSGVRKGGLFDVFAAVKDGTLGDLSAMQAHQRAPLVTTLAVMMLALSRYATTEPNSASDWKGEWDKQVGADALRIVAPVDQVAFFQPPTDPEGNASARCIEEVDRLFVAQAHSVKPTFAASPEQWVFALISGSWRHHGGVGQYAGTRAGVTAVLAGDGRTIASEVLALIEAFSKMDPGTVGRQAKPETAADHFIWMREYSATTTALPVDKVPYPFVDARPIRLVEIGDGLGAEAYAVKKTRLAGADDISDPHVPIWKGKPYKAVKSRVVDFRFAHRCIFGEPTVLRPRVLDLASGYRSVRVCAIHTDTGKTNGYSDFTVSATRQGGGFRMGPPDADSRPAELSALALTTIATGNRLLRRSLRVVFTEDGNETSQTDIYSRPAQDRLGNASIQWVLDRLQLPAEPEAEAIDIQNRAAVAILAAFEDAARAAPKLGPAYRHIVDAENWLHHGIQTNLMGHEMSEKPELPQLSRQVYAVLSEMVKHLTPNDKARLRSMSMEHPTLSFYELLAAAPERLSTSEACIDGWKVVAFALGHISQGGPHLGQALAKSDFPEMRFDRLLVATGETLRDLVADVVRWLISHGTDHVHVSELATLLLADAIGDASTMEWQRRQIAMSFVRSARRDSNADAA